MTESRLTTRILRELRAIPRSWWVKIHGAGLARAGVPDILGCVEGRMVAIEVKRPRAPGPTPVQRHEIEGLAHAGARVAVVRSPAEALRAVGGENP